MNDSEKNRTVTPSRVVVVSAAALLIISTLTRTAWERTSFWTFLLAVISLALLFIPCTEREKNAICSYPLVIPITMLVLLVLANGLEGDHLHAGSVTILYAPALALLIYAGRKKNFYYFLVVALYSLLFTFALYVSFKDCFHALLLVLTTGLLFITATATAWWMDGEGKPYDVLVSGISVVFLCVPLRSGKAESFLDYLAELLNPYCPVDYMPRYDWETIREHLSDMSFFGWTYSFCPNEIAEPHDYPMYESRLLVVLGHRIGWCAYVLVGLLIVTLFVGLVLLTIRRRGLGRLFAISTIGVVVLPLVLFYLTNLGVFDAETSYVPLMTRNLTTNLLAVLLLRLSFAFRPDPASYLTPGEILGSIFKDDDGEECDGEDDRKGGNHEKGRQMEYAGELYAFPVSEGTIVNTICDMFSKGKIAIPFKRDYKTILTGRELLYARCSGSVQVIVEVFEQLKLHGEEHFIRVSVAEESNVSELLLGVEKVTEAISEQERVDYCVCIDENVPRGMFDIRVVSMKHREAVEVLHL